MPSENQQVLRLRLAYLMRRLLILPLLLSVCSPIHAGLGSAGADVPNEIEAWCGKRKNKCKVTFEKELLTVDGTDSISRDQLLTFSCDPIWRVMGLRGIDHWEYECDVVYKENGVENSGKFIFANSESFSNFRQKLRLFCGPQCRKIGPNIQIEMKEKKNKK